MTYLQTHFPLYLSSIPGDFQGFPISRDQFSLPSFFQPSGILPVTLQFSRVLFSSHQDLIPLLIQYPLAAKVPHAVIGLLAFSNRWLLTPQSFIKPPTADLQSVFHTTTDVVDLHGRGNFLFFPPFSSYG